MKSIFVLVFFLLASPTFALPNPAAVYCEKHGGKIHMEKGKKAWIGYCVFPDHSYCEEWSYLRGTCNQGDEFLTADKLWAD